MSKAPSRGASYLVRSLKGSSSNKSTTAIPGIRSIGTGARLAFQDQASVPLSSSGSASGTVLEWSPPSAGSTAGNGGEGSARNGYHSHHHGPQGRGHRANYRHGAGSSGSASVLPSFWIQPPASSTNNALLFGTSSLSAPGPSTHATLPASLAAPQPSSSSSSTDLPSSSRLDEPGVRIPPRKASASGAQLTLHHGAFGIPKRPKASAKGKEKEVDPSDPLPKQLQELQEQLLSVQVGEDAYFVRHNSLGVADGVGGWAGRKGADPGLFAARLMHHCSAEIAIREDCQAEQSASRSPFAGNGGGSQKLSFVASSANSPTGSTSGSSAGLHTSSTDSSQRRADSLGERMIEGDPIEILHQAWDQTLTEFFDLELNGSTTALIALLKDDELRLANLGDCCCSIIRGKDYIFRSQEQQHSFNYPFQMGTNSQDTPRKDGQRFTIKVQKDDIVILSSDGLVDNLFDEDILEEVEQFGHSPQELSQALCSRAKAVSEDQRAVTSPFQQRANEEGIHFVGGKHDDISVLVAVIGQASREATD